MNPPSHSGSQSDRIDYLESDLRSVSDELIRVGEYFARNSEQHDSICVRLDGIAEKLREGSALALVVARHGVMLAVGSVLMCLVGTGLVTLIIRVMSR